MINFNVKYNRVELSCYTL